MNDRHEQSRAAFEDGLTPDDSGKSTCLSCVEYYSPRTQAQWEAWCRALDYAAEQQSKQPEPSKGYWHCLRCSEGVPPRSVTYDEHHDGGCGGPVEWRTLQPEPLTRPEWLPIDTAPLDGTCILGLHGDGRHISTINYSDGHWRLELWGSYITKPTHWMPLPATPPLAPSQKDGEQ